MKLIQGLFYLLPKREFPTEWYRGHWTRRTEEGERNAAIQETRIAKDLIYIFFASDWQIGDSGDEGGETITHSGIFCLQKTVCREGIGTNWWLKWEHAQGDSIAITRI